MQQTIKVRVSEIDRRLFQAAADASGLTLSAWVRSVVLQEVAELRARKVIT